MSFPSGVRRLFRLARRSGNIDRDVRDELTFHLATRRAELEAQGVPASEARAQAEQEYGDLDASRTELATLDRRRLRRVRGAEFLETLVQDVRYGVRGLRRSPGFTVVVLLTMALGIGANTAVFSVVNALLLNPISYRDARRLVLVWRQTEDKRMQLTPSRDILNAIRQNNRSLESFESYLSEDRTLTGHGEPSEVHTANVSATFARFAGVRVVRGRPFLPEDTKPGALPVALLSEQTWKLAFGSDESIVGKSITLDGTIYQVIGVASSSWRLPTITQTRTDVWLPLLPEAIKYGAMTIGRLKPGVDAEAAGRDLDRVVRDANIKFDVGGKPTHNLVVPLTKSVWFRDSLFILSAAVLLLLVITCANVAHLLLARGAARERELAVRRALGATHWRILRQHLTESSLIAVGGCVLGVGVGFGALKLLIAYRPARLESLTLATLDPTVLTFAVVASLMTGLTFGVIGAWSGARRGTASLRGAGGSLSGGATVGAVRRRGVFGALRNRHGMRSALVITEMALSTVLLVSASLLVRTVFNLQRINPGFDATALYAVDFTLPDSRYSDSTRREDFARRLLDGVRAIPGIASATTSGAVPPNNAGVMFAQWEAEGQAGEAVSAPAMANHVRPDFFAGIGMRMEQGHAFDEGSRARNEIIINASFAKRLFGNNNPVGGHVRSKSKPGEKNVAWYTVAGVTPNSAIGGLIVEPNMVAMYLPSKYGTDWGRLALAFRVKSGAATPLDAVMRVIRDADPTLAPPRIVAVQDALMDTVASQRFMMNLLTIFAVIALVLSGVGLYGVIAWSVAQRTREIGIRVALGGTRAHIARLVLNSGIALSVTGLGLGLVLSNWATKIVQSLLYGVQATDPWSYAIGGTLLLAVAVLACVVPLKRATGVAPLVAMRAE